MKKDGKNKKNVKFPFMLRYILIGLVVLVVVAAIVISGPTDDTVDPVPHTPTPIPTSFALSPVVVENMLPPEHSQTDGVILSAIVVVVVICAGTLFAMKRPIPPHNP